jgi:hypothetical protein
MTDKEIVQKAIEKAGHNKYRLVYEKGFYILDFKEMRVYFSNDVGVGKVEEVNYHLYEIIFSHDFAKAFWGTSRKNWIRYFNGKWEDCFEHVQYLSSSPFVYPKWQYHLQQMVLQENPLKYLEKFLEE